MVSEQIGWTTPFEVDSVIVLFGRYGTIRKVHSTHVEIRFHDETINFGRRDEATELETVEWADLVAPGA